MPEVLTVSEQAGDRIMAGARGSAGGGWMKDRDQIGSNCAGFTVKSQRSNRKGDKKPLFMPSGNACLGVSKPDTGPAPTVTCMAKGHFLLCYAPPFISINGEA